MGSTIDGKFSYCLVHAISKPNKIITSKMNYGSRLNYGVRVQSNINAITYTQCEAVILFSMVGSNER